MNQPENVVTAINCSRCIHFPEHRKCANCGLTGYELAAARTMLPASKSYLGMYFPEMSLVSDVFITRI